jgi:hypothetical protein
MTVSLKDQGNELFKQGDYLKAAAVYTKAIKEAPSAVLYRWESHAQSKLPRSSYVQTLTSPLNAHLLDPCAWHGVAGLHNVYNIMFIC